MKRDLVLARPIKLNPGGVVIDVCTAELPAVCIELCLIDYELTSQLTIWSPGTRFRVRLTRDDTVDRSYYDVKDVTATVSLSVIDLQTLASFYLKWWRDGVAEVEHQDVYIYSGADEDLLVAKAEVSREPLSGAEVTRRLLNEADEG